jgi:hypothetical protein
VGGISSVATSCVPRHRHGRIEFINVPRFCLFLFLIY